eukprot:Skav226277  [mRNA]  locus=scaffold3301:53260:61900:+ [translate_table: standard]
MPPNHTRFEQEADCFWGQIRVGPHKSRPKDASATSDPIAPDTSDLVYYWSCASGTAYDCRTLSNFGRQTWVLQILVIQRNGTGSSGPLLIVDGNQLTEGNYTFTLQVIRGVDQAVGSSTWAVDVTPSASIFISLSPSWYEGQSISQQANTDYLPSSMAYLQTGQGCGNKEASWSWALVEADSPFNILTILDSPADASEYFYSAEDLLYDYLLPGQRYSLALVEETTETFSSLVQAESLGASFSRTVPFLVDAPPAGGSLACIPMQGTAATTEFFITSSGWFDEAWQDAADMVEIASVGVNQLLSVVFSVATAYAAEVDQVAVTLVVGILGQTLLELRHCLNSKVLNLTERKFTLSLPLPDMPTEPAPGGQLGRRSLRWERRWKEISWWLRKCRVAWSSHFFAPCVTVLPLRYVYEATCATFDPDTLQWTRQGVRSKQLRATVECGVEKGMGAAIPFTVFYMPVPLPEEDEPVNVFIMVGGDGFELCNESLFLQALLPKALPVAIIVFFLCLGAVAYSNSKKGAEKASACSSKDQLSAVRVNAGGAGRGAGGLGGRVRTSEVQKVWAFEPQKLFALNQDEEVGTLMRFF